MHYAGKDLLAAQCFFPDFQFKMLPIARRVIVLFFPILDFFFHGFPTPLSFFCNPIAFTVLEGKKSSTLMEGFQKGLDNFMSNNNICNYTCYSRMEVFNSHVSGQGLIATGVRKELLPSIYGII